MIRYKESMDGSDEDKVKRKNNYVKKPVQIYAKVNNITNILYVTIGKEVIE